MVAPIAKTKFEELITQASQLLNSTPPPDEFTIRKLEREAEILRKRGIDVAGGWVISGHCAALQDDVQGAMECARRAMSASDSDWSHYLQMASALLAINSMPEVREIALAALDAYPNDAEIKRHAASLLGRAGYVVEASDLRTLADDDVIAPSVREAFSKSGFDVEDAVAPVRFARAWLRENNAPVSFSRSWASIDDADRPHVVYEIGLPMSDCERVSELEDGLYAALAEQAFPAEESGFLVFLLAPKVREATNAH